MSRDIALVRAALEAAFAQMERVFGWPDATDTLGPLMRTESIAAIAETVPEPEYQDGDKRDRLEIIADLVEARKRIYDLVAALGEMAQVLEAPEEHEMTDDEIAESFAKAAKETQVVSHGVLISSDELAALRREVEQLRVQLAGCSVAALGGTNDPAKRGTYGWSPAYQDVLNLRLHADALRRDAERLIEALEQSVKLQSHYAGLLNMYDAGQRIQFINAAAWLERLDAIAAERKE